MENINLNSNQFVILPKKENGELKRTVSELRQQLHSQQNSKQYYF